ncbi:putative repeat protein (TIGR01451 family) [Pseudoxanthomonas sp. 3HH-4]|uniref:DUF11 domain-containing protein n=1 Tax=Pseudoxanthomonas sp. 3HH-4 TaxID=1690214 RepID=UPI00115092D5|nr:DUF11 domain-containing protein [Pseudoxanthomonas sp. 3HH-4]TQM18059.1 putative repeat protein (TIGR01451 family) [Pseudoxanthomonas sp. 3HH-4]
MNVFRRLALSAVVSAAVGVPVVGQAQSCGVPPGTDVLLFVDNSSSITNSEFDAAQQAIANIASSVLSRPGYRLAVVNFGCEGGRRSTEDGCRIDLATGSVIPGGWSSNPADFAYAGSNSASNRVCRSFGFGGGPLFQGNNCGGANFSVNIQDDYAQHAYKILDGALFSGGSTGGGDSYGASTLAPATPTQRLMVIHLTDALQNPSGGGTSISTMPASETSLGQYYYSNRMKNVRNAMIVGVGIDDTVANNAQVYLGALSSKGGGSTFYDSAHQAAASTQAYDVGTPRLATYATTYSAAPIIAAADAAFDATVPACVVLRKQSVSGTGSFSFADGTNGLPSSLTLDTTTTNPATSATYLMQFNTDTGIREVIPSGYTLSSIECTNGSGANVPVTSNTSTGQLTIPGSQIVAGAQLTCTFTNTRIQPDFGTCDARMFLDQTNTGATLSTLYNVGYASTPFTYASLGSGAPRNGIGYNQMDNYIYAMEWGGFSGNELVRVGADGSTVNLGVVAGLPVTNYNNGAISPTGDYYLMSGFGGTTLYRVNLTTRVATAVTLSSSITVSDFAWHNGLLWGVNSNAGALVSIDPVSGTVTTIGSSSPVNNAIAMWGFDNGLFASGGSTIYAIDPATGAATLMSTAPGASNGDGANCPGAAIQFDADLSVTKTNTPASGPNDLPTDTYSPGETRTYTIVVTNLSGSFGAQNITVSDPIPTGIDAATVSWSCANTSGGSRCGAASGTGALNDTGLDLPPNAVATYQVTMTVPASFTGDLTNTVTITPPSTVDDTNAANNTATDVDQSAPQLTIRKISIGGVDSFGFTGTNGVVAQTLTTTTAGSPVSGATQALTAAGTATTITESTTPATYQVTDITCTGLGAGGMATPDLANRTVALDAAATAAGANVECTFTNTLRQTDIQVVKTVSPDPVVSDDVVTYQIVVSNNGPQAASNVLLTDVAGVGQDCTTPSTTATCSATGGASCPSPTVPVSSLLGAGVTIPTLPVGGTVTFGLQCTVTASGL